jgi:hypothetical protein
MRHIWNVLSIAVGTRHINDDSSFRFDGRSGFEGDGAMGVEELVGDVAEDGGAARGDASFGDEDEESGEELADVGSGGELREFGEEFGGEVGEVVLRRGGDGNDLSVTETKVGAGVQDGETAAGTVGGEMAAPGGTLRYALGKARMLVGDGFSGCESHELFLSGNWGVHPPS